jgi:peptide/nickel transport system ATP-binding protein
LTLRFGGLTAVRDVSFSLEAGEVLGVVGESGSGKSLVGLSVMGMPPEAATASGAVRLDGKDMLSLPEGERARLRGRDVAMVFQEPMTALNPLQRIGEQIAESIRWHESAGRSAVRARVLDLMTEVGLPNPEQRLRQYPHELSGGQRQRALIALALACNPSVLIADEPTTALDALVARKVMTLLRGLAKRRNMALLLISHDLAAVSTAADRVIVMYAGDLVEVGPVAEVLGDPRHPYASGLISARPRPRAANAPRTHLPTIPGTVPPLVALPPGCRFHGRCRHGAPVCTQGAPPLVVVGPRRAAACVRLETLR